MKLSPDKIAAKLDKAIDHVENGKWPEPMVLHFVALALSFIAIFSVIAGDVPVLDIVSWRGVLLFIFPVALLIIGINLLMNHKRYRDSSLVTWFTLSTLTIMLLFGFILVAHSEATDQLPSESATPTADLLVEYMTDLDYNEVRLEVGEAPLFVTESGEVEALTITAIHRKGSLRMTATKNVFPTLDEASLESIGDDLDVEQGECSAHDDMRVCWIDTELAILMDNATEDEQERT